MRKKTTYVINIVLMVVVLAFTFYTLLYGEDLREILAILRGAGKQWLCLAVCCALLYLFLQAASLKIIVDSTGTGISVGRSVKYTLIGFLFNAITPSASGGQPMQVYYMHEDGISIGVSSVALLFWTILYKVALVLIEGVVLLFFRDFPAKYLAGYEWLFMLGLGVNIVSILLYSIIVFSRNGVRNLVHLGTWFCSKLRIIRHKKQFMKRMDHAVTLYQEGAVYMRTHWEVFFPVLAITVVQRLSFFAVTWFVCLALGQQGATAWEVIMLQSFVAVCIDILPMPGGVGVNEGFFVTVFRQIMPGHMAVSAMLLSRGVNFYLFLIVGVIAMMDATVRNHTAQRGT